ncbi:HPr family phosphocarrier protein [Aquamicrobium defluvii]|uniref:Phosphocarrier protein n=1 Tax=Aquamicrobium defluvii TaxID=69279 RepID=A0A011UL27_9HYPH|nr:HPr family phosphocarrier protein [Aquamicrobium defluvii]EXL06608.1 serine kinase [Aquamicrobium defluvii]EZQ14431.1 serine kinase [Halopseudomonas bauzanensis]TDR36768.1 phosphocarrier protein [Aquamicrobium defluvii]
MSAGLDNMEELARDVKIVNQRGLHARASAKFVRMVSAFDAEISVEKDGMRVGGTSIMGLMMLAASPGCSVRVIARGPEAAAALDALAELISNRFGEEC